ncbi:hypothetical protein evm_003349 [Chilo suppressalis]|nr:hypothetical protein evm_003349 [Chilo suppressalis]
MNVGLPRCFNGDLAPGRAVLIDPSSRGLPISSKSGGLTGCGEHWIVLCTDAANQQIWNLYSHSQFDYVHDLNIINII